MSRPPGKVTFVRAPRYNILLPCVSHQYLLAGPKLVPSWRCKCGSITQIHLKRATQCACRRTILEPELMQFCTAITQADGEVRFDLNGTNVLI